MSAEPRFSAPASLEQALAELADEQPPVVLAGGTDLWPTWTATATLPARVLSLHRLTALARIEVVGGGRLLRVGACCTHGRLAGSALVCRVCPALAEAAGTIGAREIQNRGTVGGNIVNGSPAADLPPVLVAAGATVELVSARGSRELAVDRFYTGYRQTARRPDELLVAVRVPVLPAGAVERFRKVGTRRAQAISKVAGACRLELAEGIILRAGVALGSVAPTVLRLTALEAWLAGRRADADCALEAERMAGGAIHPIDDLRSTAAYRSHVAGRLVRRWIEDAGRGA